MVKSIISMDLETTIDFRPNRLNQCGYPGFAFVPSQQYILRPIATIPDWGHQRRMWTELITDRLILQ